MKLELTKIREKIRFFVECNSPEKTSLTLKVEIAEPKLEAKPRPGEASMHLKCYHLHYLYFCIFCNLSSRNRGKKPGHRLPHLRHHAKNFDSNTK